GRAVIADVDVVADPVSAKPFIAVVPQRNNLDRSLTAIENLTFHAAYFGMAQRLLIARALMHSPQVLFLDEPTTGLDPQARLFLWEMIQTLNQHGLTVLLTTHDMEEAEKLCQRVAIMDHGKILALDTPPNLSKLVPAGTRVELRIQRNASLNEEKKVTILAQVRVF